MSEPRAPGLKGIVPFRFLCQRSGRCCTAGEGFVWVGPDEVPAMAAQLGIEAAAFERRYLRRVPDPRTGVLRSSLLEEAGKCVLLEGANHCSVYRERPEHCRQFPFWEQVLQDEGAFERARAVCPGIAVEVSEATRAQAFARLEALYAELDVELAARAPRCELSGLCCRFEEAGHELYSTALEADYAASLHPQAPAPEADGRCPYHVKGRCTARAGRALGCRTYFCDEEQRDALEDLHEEFLARVRAIEGEVGYPASYGRFPGQLAIRGIGVAGNTAPASASDPVQ